MMFCQKLKKYTKSEKKYWWHFFSTPNSAYYGISMHTIALVEFEILEILAL